MATINTSMCVHRVEEEWLEGVGQILTTSCWKIDLGLGPFTSQIEDFDMVCFWVRNRERESWFFYVSNKE